MTTWLYRLLIMPVIIIKKLPVCNYVYIHKDCLLCMLMLHGSNTYLYFNTEILWSICIEKHKGMY